MTQQTSTEPITPQFLHVKPNESCLQHGARGGRKAVTNHSSDPVTGQRKPHPMASYSAHELLTQDRHVLPRSRPLIRSRPIGRSAAAGRSRPLCHGGRDKTNAADGARTAQGRMGPGRWVGEDRRQRVWTGVKTSRSSLAVR